MNYRDGRPVRLNDRVETWEGNRGIVVCSIDTREFSEAYPESQWDYLKRGVLVATERVGLIHLTDPEPALRLLPRD